MEFHYDILDLVGLHEPGKEPKVKESAKISLPEKPAKGEKLILGKKKRKFIVHDVEHYSGGKINLVLMEADIEGY
ncbi:MAG TPA: hypothetical protein ENI36_01390 [Thermoplasmatales archaeon]|nr:hypothetical protein [Thermoplasmatales archaeon]